MTDTATTLVAGLRRRISDLEDGIRDAISMIRVIHQPTSSDGEIYCPADGDIWPCDMSLVADDLDRLLDPHPGIDQ